MKSSLSVKYMEERVSKILVKSDLLTTRATVGMASLAFSLILSYHYLTELHFHDLFWIIFSMFHACVTFFALYTSTSNKLTFVGEAVCGFVLWNYISISTMISTVSYTDDVFSSSLAPLAPTFIAGLSTWWILSRYPKTEK